jgi:hypothetical protein
MMGAMKFPIHGFAVALLCLASSARATSLGLSTDPMGGAWIRGDAGSAYAVWDVFSATNFTNDAAGAAFGVTLPELDQSGVFTNFAMGAGLYKVLSGMPSTKASDNDVLFAGGNAVSFTLTGSVDFSIHGFALQIKRPGSTGGLAANFTPTLSIDGGQPIAFDSVATTFGSGDTSGDSGNWSVTTWVWSASLAGLPDTGHGAFTVSFSNAALQRGIDGIAIDVGSVAPQAVPEPATWTVLACGLGILLAIRRRHHV